MQPKNSARAGPVPETANIRAAPPRAAIERTCDIEASTPAIKVNSRLFKVFRQPVVPAPEYLEKDL